MNDNIERTKRMIEVMQAYVDGERVESRLDRSWADWEKVEFPEWNFPNVYYRIAKTPDTINWDHVAPEFKYMARGENGFGYLYNHKPILLENTWEWIEGTKIAKPELFSSYRRGTCDWKDSLVIRPGCE